MMKPQSITRDRVGRRRLDLPIRVLDAVRLEERVLVISTIWRISRKPAPNLVAYSSGGQLLWTARILAGLARRMLTLVFYLRSPCGFGTLRGSVCRIDSETGKLLESQFTK